jgi:hypothetical protein
MEAVDHTCRYEIRLLTIDDRKLYGHGARFCIYDNSANHTVLNKSASKLLVFGSRNAVIKAHDKMCSKHHRNVANEAVRTEKLRKQEHTLDDVEFTEWTEGDEQEARLNALRGWS